MTTFSFTLKYNLISEKCQDIAAKTVQALFFVGDFFKKAKKIKK